MLAGGLNIKNISEAISITKPPGIDISSGLEIKKGVKDPELIKEFVTKCRNL
jgi:phosphoribosylanthranilate isomerase